MAIYPYKNQYVRDLAWALASPPLMAPTATGCSWFDDNWYRQLYLESTDWLREIDDDQSILADLVTAEKDHRLGRYFELLWTYWFDWSERFEIIGRNIQIQHEGRTCGELDLIVHELATGRNIHIEMAVKFYLGTGDTRFQANWYGCNRQDRLDIKMDALLHKQSVMSHQPHVQHALAELGMHVDECAVILKGRLFYPGKECVNFPPPERSSAGHLRSYWLSQHELSQLDELAYVPQLRRGWLSGSRPEPGQCVYSRDEIAHAVASEELGLPLYLTGYRKHEENLHLFVVPDDWSTTL